MSQTIAIIGAGYVGVPLADTFGRAGHSILLVDVQPERIEMLNRGEDFYLAFSPERVDPGREDWTTKTTPKVVGGITEACTRKAVELYESALDTVLPLSSPEAAELTKLLENIFRSVNIALVNELAPPCDRMEFDAWEIVDAASTKPFGFMRFEPGPGLGGHCLPVDPFYLS